MTQGTKSAVLVIDMVNDFVTGVIRCDRAQRIIPPLEELVDTARQVNIPVIYVGDAHIPEDFELKIWGNHAMKGSWGAQTIPELEPRDGDYLLEKRTYDAFYETGLDMLLRKLGVTAVCITGLHTNMCDRHTAASALFRGYEIIIPRDCVDAFTEEDHEKGLEYLKQVYAARITSSRELRTEWLQSTVATA